VQDSGFFVNAAGKSAFRFLVANDIRQGCYVRRWQVFSALCGHLRSGILGGHRILSPRANWQELIAAARIHVVLPALSWCARDDNSVPREFRSYLDAVARLNGKRNERLRWQLEQVARALNDVGIEPTLLKGAAYLIGDVYPASAARLTGDLDILVPQHRGRDAIAAMQSIGFGSDLPIPESHHHFPRMRHTENDILIDVHTRLLHDLSDPIVPVAWVHEQSQLIEFRGTRVKMPPPTILVAHNIVHDQLNHERYSRKTIELRQLLDFAILRSGYEQQIDWRELDRRFSSVGLAHVLATYLLYDKVLFHQPMPAIGSAPRKHAMRRLRHAMEFPLAERRSRQAQQEQARAAEEQALQKAQQVRQAEALARRAARQARRQALRQACRNFCGRWGRRVTTVVTLPWYYIKERRRDPRGLVRILDPKAWAGRYRTIRRNLKEMQ
jgi:hypothetical protein